MPADCKHVHGPRRRASCLKCRRECAVADRNGVQARLPMQYLYRHRTRGKYCGGGYDHALAELQHAC